MSTTKTTLTANSLNNVTVGNSTTDAVIVIDYYANRGSSYGAGRIKLLNEGSLVTITHQSFGDDVGIDTLASPMAADISGTDIRLNITVDDSSVDDITFNYETNIVKL